MEHPNYYAIIPAEVRYSELKPNAKLLYGELTALCNQKGYCWATNNYFAKLYNVTKNTISLWINDLSKAGFIYIEIQRDDNKQIIKRKIGITKLNDSPRINIKEDNIKVNNIKNNISIRQMKFGTQVSDISGEIQMPVEMANEFLNYWTEKNSSGTKMRFELEKTFEIKRRLIRWKSNQSKWNNNNVKKSKIKDTLDTWSKARNMLDNINNNNFS
jgi:hypothetical protein